MAGVEIVVRGTLGLHQVIIMTGWRMVACTSCGQNDTWDGTWMDSTDTVCENEVYARVPWRS